MDVHASNEAKSLEAARSKARLAEAAHTFFVESPRGKELLEDIRHQSGANHSAFSGKDNFNPHAAAFRDGMRATFLIINQHIQNHERYNKTNSK